MAATFSAMYEELADVEPMSANDHHIDMMKKAESIEIKHVADSLKPWTELLIRQQALLAEMQKSVDEDNGDYSNK